MIVSLIAAMDRRRGIGKENRLPWRLSADLKRFRKLTMGHHLIVGRKTFESIIAIGGKPLPGRTTILVTRQTDFKAEGCFVVNSVDEALRWRARGESEVFIIGGAEIYAQTLTQADRLYLTLVDAEVEADTFFPHFNENDWGEQAVAHHAADEKNQYAFTFKTLARKS